MLATSNIIICDRSLESRRRLEAYLLENGCQVIAVDSANRLEPIIRCEGAGAVVIDLGSDGAEAVAIARDLAERYGFGIIALTAANDCVERICCLEAGADDCISKPVEPRELIARIKAVARRVSRGLSGSLLPMVGGEGAIALGQLLLDMNARRLRDPAGRDVPITEMEFSLLRTFVTHPNRALNRDELAELAYGRTWSPFDRSLDIRISRLRRKIERDPARPEVILTVRGIGYRFEPRRAA